VQEFRADPPVQPDAARHILNIGAHFFAEIRHLVDEGDLGREKAFAAYLISSEVSRDVNRIGVSCR